MLTFNANGGSHSDIGAFRVTQSPQLRHLEAQCRAAWANQVSDQRQRPYPDYRLVLGRGPKISGDTMLMFALGCVVGFIAFPIVIFLASATIAINGWMT